MEKPVVIVNPRSGGGLAPDRWAKLVKPINAGLGPFDVRFTEGPGHATVLAKESALAGAELVVAVGGDGTINEVANGLLEAGRSSCAMGIIPRGTGGDFRRSLGLPLDAEEAAHAVAKAAVRRIDVGRVTFTRADGGSATRHFVNVSSFGFSAAVADRANRSSKRLGAKASFLGATVRSLLSYDNPEVTITIDDREPLSRRVLLGAIGNGRYFGGGMKICPDAKLDDGQLDFVLVGDLGRAEVAFKSNRLYAGTHLAIPGVQHHRVSRVTVTPNDSERDILVEVDGETPGRLPATFEVVPNALGLRG